MTMEYYRITNFATEKYSTGWNICFGICRVVCWGKLARYFPKCQVKETQIVFPNIVPRTNHWKDSSWLIWCSCCRLSTTETFLKRENLNTKVKVGNTSITPWRLATEYNRIPNLWPGGHESCVPKFGLIHFVSNKFLTFSQSIPNP